MKHSKLVFDKDDTLRHLAYIYDQSAISFISALYHSPIARYLPCWQDVVAVYREKDKAGFDRVGVARGGLAQAMLETVEEVRLWIMSHHGFDPAKRFPAEWANILEQAAYHGDGPFRRYAESPAIEGAEEVLAELQTQGHELFLLSNYDLELFPVQYKALGLGRFFGENLERAVAVEFKKKPKDFLDLVSRTPQLDSADICVAVGNSLGDMPMKDLPPNWHGFRVPFATSSVYVGAASGQPGGSKFDPPPSNDPRVTDLKNLSELPARIAALCA